MIVRNSFIVVLVALFAARSQVDPRVDALTQALRPVLPYPEADADGELPVAGGADSKWFVIWPQTSDDRRIHVKANPLHPETQAAGAAAMARIQAAVERAERKAQAAYEKALEELRRTGKSVDLDGVTLEDEGVAGQRIDAELELVIEVNEIAAYEIGSAEAPEITSGPNGVTWSITTKANTYRDGDGPSAREQFRAAEARLIFGSITRPVVRRLGDAQRFTVGIAPVPGAFMVVLRGNEGLLNEVVAGADWTRVTRAPR